jgi:DNA-binding transcriptional regulator PaaX
VGKYKYYFKKPRSEVVKDILKTVLIAGAITVAAASPYFVRNILRSYTRFRRYPARKISDVFARLKREGLIEINRVSGQIYIKLTPEGKKKAGIYRVDSLKIKKPKKWDGKWRIVIFDIAELKRMHREAFRGKLKELGFFPLQKSVWVHAFSCQDEVALLRDFFGLNKEDVRTIVAEKIENSDNLKQLFNLK